MGVYHRRTTFQQRIRLFELVEQLGNVSEACRRAKKQIAQWIWKGHCTRKRVKSTMFLEREFFNLVILALFNLGVDFIMAPKINKRIKRMLEEEMEHRNGV